MGWTSDQAFGPVMATWRYIDDIRIVKISFIESSIKDMSFDPLYFVIFPKSLKWMASFFFFLIHRERYTN